MDNCHPRKQNFTLAYASRSVYYDMLLFAFLLGLASLLLSTFCSGTETGFYRVPRIQLKLEAMQGDLQSKGLLWLANRPSIFVATILVANNTGNYLVSVAGVLFLHEILGDGHPFLTELCLTLFLSPILFVYGEMFPKYVCLLAPKRFLKLGSPFLFFLTVLLLPLSSLLWLINRFYAGLFGRSKEMIRLSLARSELVKTFDEGHEVGVLGRVQRQLIDGVIAASEQGIKSVAVPVHHYPLITSDMKPSTVLSLAHSLRLCEIPVFGSLDALDGLVPSRAHLVPVGYVRTIDLELTVRRTLGKLPLRELVEVIDNYSILTALNLFQTSGESLGMVVDSHKRCFGLVSPELLREQLFQA